MESVLLWTNMLLYSASAIVFAISGVKTVVEFREFVMKPYEGHFTKATVAFEYTVIMGTCLMIILMCIGGISGSQFMYSYECVTRCTPYDRIAALGAFTLFAFLLGGFATLVAYMLIFPENDKRKQISSTIVTT